MFDKPAGLSLQLCWALPSVPSSAWCVDALLSPSFALCQGCAKAGRVPVALLPVCQASSRGQQVILGLMACSGVCAHLCSSQLAPQNPGVSLAVTPLAKAPPVCGVAFPCPGRMGMCLWNDAWGGLAVPQARGDRPCSGRHWSIS